jgi:NTP pyrophosphatase (non-canonical NTP hydrolase)
MFQTRDPKIIEELYELARELEKLEKTSRINLAPTQSPSAVI